MRQVMLTTALVVGLVVGAGGFTTAQAESFFHAIGGARIGGVHFTVGYHSAPRHRHYPGRYYRTKHKIKGHGYGRRCGKFCYREGGYYNHHESCGLLGAHLVRHSYSPRYYAPPYRVYGYQYDYGYGRRNHGYRHYDNDYDDDRRHHRRHRRERRHRRWR